MQHNFAKHRKNLQHNHKKTDDEHSSGSGSVAKPFMATGEVSESSLADWHSLLAVLLNGATLKGPFSAVSTETFRVIWCIVHDSKISASSCIPIF